MDGERPEHAGLRRMIGHSENKVHTGAFDRKNEHTLQVVQEMLESQRRHLVEIDHGPGVNEEVIRQELYLIDLERSGCG